MTDQDDAQAAAVAQKLVMEGIQPNAGALAQIWQRQGVACLVFEISPGFENAPRNVGWDGVAPVFELTTEALATMSRVLREGSPGDTSAVRWLSATWSERPYRLFVFMHQGTLLLNWTDGVGFKFEPGSQDHEWKS